ncbi:MAG: hypothetical protein KI790_01165 [Cyclobacteriaceae bacterium]|nr:hypothetical protein [Cyclobacteriaceae bacterium HetDA_MAG_MS6]
MMRYLLLTLVLISWFSGHSQAYATINSFKQSVVVKSPSKAEVMETISITVHQEKGYDLSVYFETYDKFNKVQSLTMVIKDRNGKKVKKLNKEDAHDYAYNEDYETDDSRNLYLEPDYKQYPFTVEIQSKVERKGFLNLAWWNPQHAYNMAVKHAELEVKVPQGYEFRQWQKFVNEPEVGTDQKTGDKRFFWSVKDLPPVKNSVDRSVFLQNRPMVILVPNQFEYGGYAGQFETWEQFGNWFLEVNSGFEDIGEETKEFLDGLDFANKRQAINKVYSYMQNRTRYVSIQLGIGGFQTLPASLVDSKGYGDCKALTNYMKAMLSYKNIPSNYILVRAGEDEPDWATNSFPFDPFNHVFLGVPLDEDTIYLECTSQTSPPDFVGTFTDDRNVLWVAKDDSKLVHMPIYSEEDNVISKNAKLNVDELGNGAMDLHEIRKGIYYSNIRSYKSLGAKRLERYNYKLFTYKDFTISSFDYEEEEGLPAYESNFKLQVNNLAKNTASKLLLPINTLQPIDHYIDLNRYTKFSEIKRGFTIEENVEVLLPENYWIQRLPESKSLDSDFGNYQISVDYEGDILKIRRKVIIKKGRYEQDDFDPFYDFVQQIRRTDGSKLVMESKT